DRENTPIWRHDNTGRRPQRHDVHRPLRAKRGIIRPGGSDADHRKLLMRRLSPDASRHEDRAIALQCQAGHKKYWYLSSGTEAQVRRAVGVVAHELRIAGTEPTEDAAGDHNLAIRL